MDEGAWWWEHEMTSHTEFAVRYQREMNASSAYFLFFIKSRAPVHRIRLPTEWVFLLLLSHTSNDLSHDQQCFS